VVEEEDPDWPLDADVGWGIRASEYFDKTRSRTWWLMGWRLIGKERWRKSG